MNGGRPYSRLFRYVDFGTSANALLRNCGVRDIPSMAEIVQQVISDPELVLDKVGNEATYIALLKEIAVNFDSIPKALRSSMLNNRFCLASRRARPSFARLSRFNRYGQPVYAFLSCFLSLEPRSLI
mmetsp:Transcript_6527/g.9357  ORF Transcript_6527/g.9357 Transcript_6527/m.9357 type:complete len:127 (+) Transcript_6527:1252-1632(+)